MTAVPVYAGIIVRELEVSTDWYTSTLGCRVADTGPGWAMLRFANGSAVELFSGDPAQPGAVFPSYGGQPGPAVMPGFAIEDPDLVAEGLPIARSLPDWIVIVCPDGLRLVLADRDGDGRSGVVGFRFTSPAPQVQEEFFDRVRIKADVAEGAVGAVPVIAGDRDGDITDPDGNPIALTRVAD